MQKNKKINLNNKMKPIIRNVTQTVCEKCGKLIFIATSNVLQGGQFLMDKFEVSQKFIDGKITFTEKNWGHKCEK